MLFIYSSLYMLSYLLDNLRFKLYKVNARKFEVFIFFFSS